MATATALPGGGAGGGLDLAHRLAEGDMHLMVAILDYQHALIMASHAHRDWDYVRARDHVPTSLDWWADRWRDGIVRLAHAAHTLERQLDARDAQREQVDVDPYFSNGAASRDLSRRRAARRGIGPRYPGKAND